MSEFITTNDIWGIRETIREIWKMAYKKIARCSWDRAYEKDEYEEFYFNAFFNQRVPEAWRESKSTVMRHIGEIKALAQTEFVDRVWYVRNGQMSAANAGTREQHFQFWDSIDKKEVTLPTYIEIEEEQQKWQAHPDYNKERGFSSPIREEFIQIRIHK